MLFEQAMRYGEPLLMDATFADGEQLKEGDLVVYPGQGLCKVVGAQQVAGKQFLMLEVVHGGMKLGLPMELAKTTLTRPMSEPDAQRALLRLLSTDTAPDTRPRPYRYRDAAKALARGPSDARVEQLLKFYRSPHQLSFDEQKLVEAFESVVLEELALSLGKQVDELKATLTATHPLLRGEVPERPELEPFKPPRPAPPFELPAHEYLGTFRIAQTLVVAEPGVTLSLADQPAEEAVRHNAHVLVKPGNYFAFLRNDEDSSGVRALIAVHQQFAEKLLSLSLAAFELVGVIVEGGHIAMLDEAVRTDPAFVDEMEFPLFPDGLILDRGCIATTGRAGVLGVKIARPLGETVFVMVEF